MVERRPRESPVREASRDALEPRSARLRPARRPAARAHAGHDERDEERPLAGPWPPRAPLAAVERRSGSPAIRAVSPGPTAPAGSSSTSPVARATPATPRAALRRARHRPGRGDEPSASREPRSAAAAVLHQLQLARSAWRRPSVPRPRRRWADVAAMTWRQYDCSISSAYRRPSATPIGALGSPSPGSRAAARGSGHASASRARVPRLARTPSIGRRPASPPRARRSRPRR